MEAKTAAVEAMYHEHKAAVYYTALAIVRSRPTAEDILHMVFEKVLALSVSPGSIRNPRAWMTTLARNQALNYVRDHRRELPEAEPWPEGAVADEMTYSTEVEAMLDGLDKTERFVFIMHGLHKYTYKEIAVISGRPLGTVQSTYARARAKLKRRLRDSEDMEGGRAV